jgi:hypothetical protein
MEIPMHIGDKKSQKERRARAISYVVTILLFVGRVSARHQRETAIVLNWLLCPALLIAMSGWANSIPRQKVIRWIGLVVVVITVCVALGWYEIPPAPTVTVSPSEVTFQNQWRTYPFSITNGLDQSAYEVVVKFAYGVPPEEFKMDTPPTSSKPLGDGPGGHKVGDMTGMSCRTEQGTYATFLTIYRMSPGETREINFTRIKPGTVRMQTRISFFTEVPQDFVNALGGTAQRAQNDEACTVVQLSFELK